MTPRSAAERGPGTAAGPIDARMALWAAVKLASGISLTDEETTLAVASLTTNRWELHFTEAATAAVPEAPYDTEKGPTTQQVADSRFLERERASECDHGEGCICTELRHAGCCGALRTNVLASLATAAVPLNHGDHVPAWKWCYFGLTIGKAEAQGVPGHRFCEGCARLSADEENDALLIDAAVNALPSLIEAARREAGLREALRAIPRLRLTGEQLDSIAPPPQGADQFAIDWDEYDDFVPGTMLDALLHDNAGATEPAEGTE